MITTKQLAAMSDATLVELAKRIAWKFQIEGERLPDGWLELLWGLERRVRT